MSSYSQLETTFKELYHLSHVVSIAAWDEAVMMPQGGGAARAEALATLAKISHEKLTDNRVGDWIAKAKDDDSLSEKQKRNLALIDKRYQEAVCLPADLVKRKTEARIRCEQAWREMRAQNDWVGFKPLLEEVLSLVKEGANIKAEIFSLSPYDVLIDQFSPGINQATISPVFAKLKQALPDLISDIIEKQKKQSIVEFKPPFAIDSQKNIGMALMKKLGFDFNQGRLDVSHHPFCGGVAEDVRITTRYDENSFIGSVMGVCHETGHAMYEFGLPQDMPGQPVSHSLGMTVHESQSLLVEMQVCRSKAFMHQLLPLLIEEFGEQEAFTIDNLHRHYLKVEPGYIRVDADEVTYPLHVILRYEVEQGLIKGEMSLDDLPAYWDNFMTQYLGLTTKDNYQDGVMQDVHWPSGAFGYFPAYTLGALTASQLFECAKKAMPDMDSQIQAGDLSALFIWLRQHVHTLGASLTYDELMQKATGETLNPDIYLAHIKRRYL